MSEETVVETSAKLIIKSKFENGNFNDYNIIKNFWD